MGEICWYASGDSNVKVGSLSKVRQEASKPCPGNVCGVVVPVCLVEGLTVDVGRFPHHSKIDGRRDVLRVERYLGMISQLLPEVAPQFALLSQVVQEEPETIRLLFGNRKTSARHPRSQPSTQQFGDCTPMPAIRKLSGARSWTLALAKLTPSWRQQILYWVEL